MYKEFVKCATDIHSNSRKGTIQIYADKMTDDGPDQMMDGGHRVRLELLGEYYINESFDLYLGIKGELGVAFIGSLKYTFSENQIDTGFLNHSKSINSSFVRYLAFFLHITPS